MARLPMPDIPSGKLQELIKELHDLHRLAGWPSLRVMASEQNFSYATVSDLFSKFKKQAPRPEVLLAIVEVLANRVRKLDVDATLDRFDAMWRAASLSPFDLTDNGRPSRASNNTERAGLDDHPLHVAEPTDANPDDRSLGLLDQASTDSADSATTAVEPAGVAAAGAESPTSSQLLDRRLEQHFVYNSLNAIASLIRTDPSRARELLVGFAALSSATDRPGEAPSTLGNELMAIRDYLALEKARFGKRLQVQINVDQALLDIPVKPLRLLAAVREAVQHDIEPSPQGGLLSVSAHETKEGCVVTVTAGRGEPQLLVLEATSPPNGLIEGKQSRDESRLVSSTETPADEADSVTDLLSALQASVDAARAKAGND